MGSASIMPPSISVALDIRLTRAKQVAEIWTKQEHKGKLGGARRFSMPDTLLPLIREDTGNPLVAAGIARGVMRLFGDLGFAALQEFPLRVRRRADIVALNHAGEIVIVEIKSCRADFKSDQKWPEYMEFCDRFFFAVAPEFPRDILPAECGLIVADRHGGAIMRESAAAPLNGNRRRAQILQIALTASQRLARVTEPLL
jgi:hypothetical protein